MAVARGFFGGGETSYVLLTIDGAPVNDGRTGLVEWTQVPLSDIERIEVLRGSASVAYGDAALGAVINIVTRGGAAADGVEASVALGSWGGGGLQAALSRPLASGRLKVTIDADREGGYRAHSESSRLAASLAYRRTSEDGARSLVGRLSLSRISNQEPGPLDPAALTADRLGSHAAFSGDERRRIALEMFGGLHHNWDDGRRLESDVRLRVFDQERTRTLLLVPSFGDTQSQDDHDVSAWARVQFAMPIARSVLRIGGEAELAAYRNRYLAPSSGLLQSEGEGRQAKLATHAELRVPLGSRVRLHAAARFDAVLPSEDGAADAAPSFHQWSPRLAINVAYRDRPSSSGNLFVSWTRAFKAPSLDQLYDAREIPSGEPGVAFNLSNAGLRPQRSSAVEVGAYQVVPLGSTGRHVELSVSWYRQELEDEVDFDVRTFRYGNISRSRHTGFEASARAVLSPRVRLEHAATLGRVIFRTEEFEGNQVKNVPETAFVSSLHLRVSSALQFTLTHRTRGGVYLDDANTRRLDGNSLFDAGIRARVGRFHGVLTASNLLDAEYDSFGFLLFDPFKSASVPLVHPGAGRSLGLRLTVPAG